MGNYVEMLELADNWMGKRNRLARLVVDWKLVQDECGEWKKKNGVTESLEMSKEQTEDGCENEKSEGQGDVVSFMLKDPVVFECVTRCTMTGETREDSALVHETSVVMKVQDWELRGMEAEEAFEEREWAHQKIMQQM